jgi:hypothetical protein
MDGTGTGACFLVPMGIAIYAPTGSSTISLVVADYAGSTIRLVTTSGIVTTLAGLANDPGSANGVGTNTRFDSPVGIVADTSGNIFVADQSISVVRMITSAGEQYLEVLRSLLKWGLPVVL